LIRVGAYFTEDFDALDINNVEHIGNLEELRPFIAPDHSRTGWHGDKLIAAAGVVPMWPGVGLGWVLVDKSAPHKLALARAMRKGVRDIVAEGPFHRVQADVKKSYVQGQKFLKMLGFAPEGPLWAYTSDGEDFVRYSFVNRDLVVRD